MTLIICLFLVTAAVKQVNNAHIYVESNSFFKYELASPLVLATLRSQKCYEIDLHIKTYCYANISSYLRKTSIIGLVNGVTKNHDTNMYASISRQTIHKTLISFTNYSDDFEVKLILERGKGCPSEPLDIDVKTFAIFELDCVTTKDTEVILFAIMLTCLAFFLYFIFKLQLY